MKKVICSPFALVLGCALFVQAQNASRQDPPKAQQPAVTFKTGVDLVAVDVSVVDRRGRPVSDLGADDFVLTVDGRPRKLVSAQYISQTRTLETAPAKPEYYSTNAGTAAGRLIMLVVDQSNIHQGGGKIAAEAAARFIDRLNRGDRVGLTVIPGAGRNLDFTANHALVKTLIGRVVGTADKPVGSITSASPRRWHCAAQTR